MPEADNAEFLLLAEELQQKQSVLTPRGRPVNSKGVKTRGSKLVFKNVHLYLPRGVK